MGTEGAHPSGLGMRPRSRTLLFTTRGAAVPPADPALSSQRSEVVKSSLPVQKSLLLSSEGIASKRNFFEASAPGKAEPLAARKVTQEPPASPCAGADTSFSGTSSPLQRDGSAVLAERCRAAFGHRLPPRGCSGAVRVCADALVLEELGWSPGVG